MDLPSRVASYAARPLLRPRGVCSSIVRSSTLAPLARRFRSVRERRASRHARGASDDPALGALSRPGASPRGLRVEEVVSGGSHVLVLSGELDGDSIALLEDAIARCRLDGISSLTLDLSGLEFIDSSGLWTITLVKKWCERHGNEFALIPGPEPVQRVFEVTGLSDVLPFADERPSGGPHAPESGSARG
jgi:anti-sigma B factor antagonist